MSKEVTTYDPMKVTVSLGGRVITGFASDGVITLTHNEGAVTPNVGAKGDVTYSENANNSGTAASPTSASCAPRKKPSASPFPTSTTRTRCRSMRRIAASSRCPTPLAPKTRAP